MLCRQAFSSSYCSCSAAGICVVAFDGLLADENSIRNKAGVASVTQVWLMFVDVDLLGRYSLLKRSALHG